MSRDTDYPPCPQRIEMVAFRANGDKERVQRCGALPAPKSTEYVKPEDCFECPVREMLMREAVKGGTYVHERKLDTSRAIKKVPDKQGGGFVPCDHRMLVVLPICCGHTLDTWQCKSQASPYFDAEVAPIHCENCKVRQNGTQAPQTTQEGQA